MKTSAYSGLTVLFGAFFGQFVAASAAPPDTGFTYQGTLRESGGPADGDHDMRFTLFDANTGGLSVGPTLAFDGVGPNPPPVSVNGGLFAVELDFGPVFIDRALWLEIEVRSTGGGAYSTLAPRQSLDAAPFSLQTRGIAVDSNANVGIGTMAPQHPLHVSGDFRSDGRVAIGNDAHFGLGGGVYPDWDRVFDISHTITDFTGASAWAPLTSTITLDPDQYVNTEILACGFEGRTAETCDQDLVFVIGLLGAANHNGSGRIVNQFGAFLVSETPGTGDVTRNYGTVISGGSGRDSNSTIDDNYGLSILTGHWGDSGSIGTNRVLNVQTPLNTHPIDVNYGIYIEDQNVAQTTNYAIYSAGGDVYLDGDLDITGTISKGGGSFKIDHPLDPQNKYLFHSFVESPDMMNIYNGNATTDARGYAVIQLPEWFEALNRDFRYQLTVVDTSDSDAFVQAKVVREITGNEFTIRTSAPQAEVSWQVTGVRHDKFAESHRIPVEQVKPADERGRFLHPAAFGQPAHKSVEHHRRPNGGVTPADLGKLRSR